MARLFVLVFLASLGGVALLSAVFAVAFGSYAWWFLVAVCLVLLVVGIHDVVQKKHAILRNYPVLGHARFLFEFIRPEIQQYFIERNTDGKPFDRDTRSLIYSRAKGADSHKAFGTEREVNRVGYEFLLHSTAPLPPPADQHKVRIGSSQCTAPAMVSLLNISSMSFGSLSRNAVLAMNKGAAMGGFMHETGEGGLTEYHLRYGADLFWEIGSGYFGCRNAEGRFDAEVFAAKAAREEVKGITIKLSQGAKPGLGGVLPAAKVSAAIARARGVPMGQDCISPPSHPEFDTPRELMAFVERLRVLSGGKPVGIKLCVGSRTDVLAICKAMLETGTLVDFITVDGSEGGTGAAPLTEGLMLVHNALVGTGLRDEVRVGAAGKIATGSDIVKRLIQGADFCFAARPMMMATGCIQAQKCHTNKCPVGVATQDRRLAMALNVQDKGNRVYNYHRLTVLEAAQLMASMGAEGPGQLSTRMLRRRVNLQSTRSYSSLFHWLRPGELLDDVPSTWAEDWVEADAEHFGEHAPLVFGVPQTVNPVPPRVEPRENRKVKPVHPGSVRPEGQPGRVPGPSR